MGVDKLIKKQIIEEASSNPEKYFPVKTLKNLGFQRYKCESCGTMFYSSIPRKICGDTSCVKTYDFIDNTPAKKPLEFSETYLEFQKFMSKRGYLGVKRFPIVARWRDDLDFNIASIIGFQPYVTKGVVQPPAELVTIPQNCLRFGDIDNVGFTGRHGTNFVMIGQLAFKTPEEYNQAKYVQDLLEFFTEIVKIPKDEIQLHEDAWCGGGDCGPSIEFFSRGLEIANQVYMIFDMSEAKDICELKELSTKVLDMGMGLERCCWFSKGSVNQYQATMPKVCDYLFEKTNISPNWELYKKFLPYSGNLNLDEIENISTIDKNGNEVVVSGIDLAWEEVANHVGVDSKTLRSEVEPIAGIYSIADHSKTLLYALHDGALPSNVKGGYNLRLVLRRAMDFITKYNFDIDLCEVIAKHVDEVKELYPDINENLENTKKIISHEISKYFEHQQKIEIKAEQFAKKGKEFTQEEFVKLYISEGITPEDLEKSYQKQGKKISIPTNFFTLVTEYFENQKSKENKKKQNIFKEYTQGVESTKLAFYDDFNIYSQESNIIKEFELENNKYIILDSTLFYPTMGGQANDTGFIGDYEVIDVIKVGDVIIHKVK